MADIAIKVIIRADQMGQTEVLCKRLSDIGLHVDTTMPEIGVIFGHGDAGILADVAKAEGVISAEAEGGVVLAPMPKDTPK